MKRATICGDKSEAAFRSKFERIAEDCKVSGFNTIIAQVRPFCDALYSSKLFPASHVLSGEQGKSLGYDALRIMCAVCRKHDLRLHAWVYPYRVSINQTPACLSENNPYVQDPQLGIETESGIIIPCFFYRQGKCSEFRRTEYRQRHFERCSCRLVPGERRS